MRFRDASCIAGIGLMALAGILQFEVLRDLYIQPKEEMGPVLASGALATIGFVMILFGTENQSNDQ